MVIMIHCLNVSKITTIFEYGKHNAIKILFLIYKMALPNITKIKYNLIYSHITAIMAT